MSNTEKMRAALQAAKEKLILYRSLATGEYVGGTEYTALIRQIDEALGANAPVTLADDLAAEQAALARRVVHHTRPKGPMSLADAVALCKRMES